MYVEVGTTGLQNTVLTLRIDNFDKLPNGSPLEYTVDRRGFDFGRDQHLDWTLPDKSRVISGKHCEVRFYENAYWLIDTSTNGTFLNDSAKRMQSPYCLNNGDKLAVGDYVLFASVNLGASKSAEQFSPSFVDPPSNESASPPPLEKQSIDSIWETQSKSPPPIDARDLMQKQNQGARATDFLNQAAAIPQVYESDPIRKPIPSSSMQAALQNDHDAWFGKKEGHNVASSHERAEYGQSTANTQGREPASASSNEVDRTSALSSEMQARAVAKEFITRFANGAGIPADALSQLDAGDLAEQTGQLLNAICLQLMIMLHARAEAKALSRSGNRTLIQSAENNPLKFMPTPEEALKTMLNQQSKGYLGAQKAIESSFADLKLHQMASLAAMQTAAAQLFDDLSPETIIKSLEGKKSLLSGGKGKQWDVYAERWSAKVGHREHGMLGAFLELFAEQYDKLSKHK